VIDQDFSRDCKQPCRKPAFRDLKIPVLRENAEKGLLNNVVDVDPVKAAVADEEFEAGTDLPYQLLPVNRYRT